MNNSKSGFILIVGMVALFLSVIGGFQLAQDVYGIYNWEAAVPYITGGIVTFAFFLGLSEIIRLLNGILEKLKEDDDIT